MDLNRGFVIAAAGAALALAACGGGSQAAKPTPKPTPTTAATKPTPAVAPNLTAQQQIENVLREYNQAQMNGDGATACLLMTPRDREATQHSFNHDYGSCPEAIHEIGPAVKSMLQPQQIAAWTNPKITGSEIAGNSADVAWSDGSTVHRVVFIRGGTQGWLIDTYT